MDRITTLTVFRRVAELESFSAAARELRLSNAAVSKHIAHLEERIRTRLLQRTTRRVSLTPAGSAYLERCARILDEIDELDQSAMQGSTVVKGTLRVNGPSAFGLMYLSPVVPSLLSKWPDLAIDLSLTDRFVDLIEEGVDVAVRIASTLPDSATLVAQRLATCEQIAIATPAYLRKRGTPKTPADLADHDCLIYGLRRPVWEFEVAGKLVNVPVSGRLRVDNSLGLRDAVLAHAGIAMLPKFYVQDLLDARRVRVLLPTTPAPSVRIHAVYPRQRHLATKIRVFIEHVRAHLVAQAWARETGARVNAS
jgi:DNA-binding transcriptional LysR family regulator